MTDYKTSRYPDLFVLGLGPLPFKGLGEEAPDPLQQLYHKKR